MLQNGVVATKLLENLCTLQPFFGSIHLQLMCDIVALVSAVHAPLPARPSVPPDCVELAISARRKFQQRSWEHAKHARTCRQLREARRVKMKLTKKACNQISAYNTSLAIRPGDRIVVGWEGHPLARGRGGYRRWLPQALLRCCFGLGCRSVKKVGREKPQPRSGLHMAPRTVAEWFRGGHSHVQRIRNAVAETICAEVEKRIEETTAGTLLLEVSFDETKEPSPPPHPPPPTHPSSPTHHIF